MDIRAAAGLQGHSPLWPFRSLLMMSFTGKHNTEGWAIILSTTTEMKQDKLFRLICLRDMGLCSLLQYFVFHITSRSRQFNAFMQWSDDRKWWRRKRECSKRCQSHKRCLSHKVAPRNALISYINQWLWWFAISAVMLLSITSPLDSSILLNL